MHCFSIREETKRQLYIYFSNYFFLPQSERGHEYLIELLAADDVNPLTKELAVWGLSNIEADPQKQFKIVTYSEQVRTALSSCLRNSEQSQNILQDTILWYLYNVSCSA